MIIACIFSFIPNIKAEENEKDYRVVIEDNANLLTTEEVEKLEEQMKEFTKYGHIAFKSILENEKTTEEYADEYYEQKFNNESGTLLLLDMKNNYLYICSLGENKEKLTESVEQSIVDNVIQYAIAKEYYTCASQAYQEMLQYLEKENINVKNEESNYKLIIEDDANLLTAEEIQRLQDKMQPLTKYGHIAFKSILNNTTTTASYIRDYYHSQFGTESGTVFLIDMDNRQIYIFSDGTNYNIITNHKAEIITDNIYKYATNKDYYTCAYDAYDQIETLLEGGKILEPMRYISNIVVSIVTAFFTSFLIVLKLTNIKQASADKVLTNCNVDFKVTDIYGSKTGTHRRYAPVSDSSSGGGSSGGGGGGGGSSGGGGGHSF